MKAYARNKRSESPTLKKFKMAPKYTHHRSEGLTHRRNAGSRWQEAPHAAK